MFVTHRGRTYQVSERHDGSISILTPSGTTLVYRSMGQFVYDLTNLI